jgi:carboxylesterase
MIGPAIPDLFDPLCAPFRLEGDRDEAVVLVHGFTGVPAHFRPLAEFLNAHGYTVNVPLLAGHGTTIEDMAQTGWRDWLRSTEQAVAAVSSHRRIHLAGLSMGGLLAVVAASRSGASTVTTINSPLLVRNKQMYLAPLIHRLRPVVIWPDSEPPNLDPEVRPYWLTYPGFHTKTVSGLLRLSMMCWTIAGRIRRPALVIQSKVDESVDPRSATILARRLGPGTDLVWLERAFHNALLSEERTVIHQRILERIA